MQTASKCGFLTHTEKSCVTLHSNYFTA
uniref:Uncharacterized protein n=1 Tax=Anguilla anguilla TaxID=7936 RepID=A0A0E9TD20_ANGAN